MRIAALLALIIISPLIILVVIFLMFQTGSGIIFRQQRVGKGKKPFTIFKFRTMNDGSITTQGRILRKLGLDEIPQLLNILRGEMAFIGPRPLTQFDIDRLNWNRDECSARWDVLPGITGLAQLNPICSADASLSNDLEYVHNRSLLLDVKILVNSALVPIRGKRTQ